MPIVEFSKHAPNRLNRMTTPYKKYATTKLNDKMLGVKMTLVKPPDRYYGTIFQGM